MIMTRSSAITAAVAAAAALTATGITYASASAAPVPQAAPAAVQAPAPVQAPMGGEGGQGNEGNEGNGGERGNDHGGGKDRDYDEGWIHINERSYTARPGGCITVVSGLGSRTLNIRNDSRKTIEVFRGVTCDNGAPIATVGPRSSSNGVRPGCTEGVRVEDGVVGSFRVIHDYRGGKGDRGDY